MSTVIPLKRVVAINPETLGEDTPGDLEFKYVDIGSVGRGQLVDEPAAMTFAEAPSRARRVLRPGDTVVSTVRTYLRAVLPIEAPGLIGSTGFACLRPGGGIDPRFLGWWAQSDVFIEEVVARSTGVSYPAINPSEIGSMRIPVRPLAEQRAIADFLDTETARIDALITKKQALAGALEERFQSLLSSVLWGRTTERVRLKYLCGLPSSGNRDHQSFTDDDSGIPCLRGLNIRPGRIESDELRYVSPGAHAAQSATQLTVGDVVIVRSGFAGAAAAITPELDGANCVDLVVVRRSRRVVPRWLEYVLNSREAQEQVARRQAGAILTHFNAVDAGNVLLPAADFETQRAVVAELDGAAARRNRLAKALRRQTELLDEHRQALITASVTGQMDVPGVAA